MIPFLFTGKVNLAIYASSDISNLISDSDQDGLPDSWELNNALSPVDDGSIDIDNGADGDPDGDGLPNAEEYQQGFDPQSNDFGRAYERRPAKATIMIIGAHPDDEGIFFGGAIPYYTQTLDVPTVFICMTSGDFSLAPSVREAEMRNAAWVYGLRSHPIFPRFRDYWFGTDSDNVSGSWDIWNDNVLGNGDELDGRLKATRYIAAQIRKYRPEVVVGHDFEGEYGHSNHKAAAIATADGFAMAADPAVELEGLAVWQAKKLYIHNYDRDASALSKLFHDHWETPSIGGLTPREVANNGLSFHATQDTQTVSTAYLTGETASPVFDPYPSEEWGLHTSFVGTDSMSANFSINGKLYSGYARSDFLQNVSIDRDADLLPDDWENRYSGSHLAMEPDADTDGDGWNNHEEFSLGLDPLSADRADLLNLSPVHNRLTFTLPEAKGIGYTGVIRRYVLESSTDLIVWTQERTGVADGALVEHIIELEGAQRFYRLVITVE